jgi:hypothetical protein
VSDLPPEGEKLLAVAPDDFVAQRQRLARELRDAGRAEDADTVARLRKPPAVVSAVNRAARDRPRAAASAVEAAERVAAAQADGDAGAFERAVGELAEALDLLAEVAAAHVAPQGKSPSDAMRRRVRDLLRSAVADDAARDALRRGALREEVETAGFSPYAGMVAKPGGRRRSASGPSRAEQREADREMKRRARVEALEAKLEDAERMLEEAERSLRAAERERTTAEREVKSLRAKLDRLEPD